jgi:hypothetical protein
MKENKMKTGTELKNKGMKKAAKAQNNIYSGGNFTIYPKWTELAYMVIESTAKKNSTVHVDDVAKQAVLMKLPVPEKSNAWGSVWTKAIRNGLIQRSGNMRAAGQNFPEHAHKHARLYPVYDSLVF